MVGEILFDFGQIKVVLMQGFNVVFSFGGVEVVPIPSMYHILTYMKSTKCR